jgi:hypothetical protein
VRWIDRKRVQRNISAEWITESNRLLLELINAPDKVARLKIISTNSPHWNKVRKELWTIGGEKCWYTEAMSPLKTTVIEHFRPKGKIAGETHEGYWWLTFNWKNFRIASSVANIRVRDELDGKLKGKGTYFPLIGGTRVSIYAPTPLDEMSIGNEIPLLLDPFKRKDVELLTFTQDGLPVPNPVKCLKQKDVERVVESIGFYCLDDGLLNAERADLWHLTVGLCSRIEELAQSMPLNAKDDEEFGTKLEELAQLVDKAAKFSASAISALKLFGNRGWTEEVLSV